MHQGRETRIIFVHRFIHNVLVTYNIYEVQIRLEPTIQYVLQKN